MFASIKILEIKTSMPFSLNFANNTILSSLFLFFVIIGLYFLIPATFVQIFNPVAKRVIPIGIPSKEAKTEIQIHPVIEEVKRRKCSI